MTHRATMRVTLSNSRGMHARPCQAIVSAALASKSSLRVRCGEREVDGRSILSLMTLGAAHGAQLDLTAEGEDADELLEQIRALVERDFAQFD